MQHKISDLREMLFEQIKRLQDSKLDLSKEVQRAAAIVPVANTIIETGRLENEFLKILNGQTSLDNGFIQPNKKLGEHNKKDDDEDA